jgi:hypothetical protein
MHLVRTVIHEPRIPRPRHTNGPRITHRNCSMLSVASVVYTRILLLMFEPLPLLSTGPKPYRSPDTSRTTRHHIQLSRYRTIGCSTEVDTCKVRTRNTFRPMTATSGMAQCVRSNPSQRTPLGSVLIANQRDTSDSTDLSRCLGPCSPAWWTPTVPSSKRTEVRYVHPCRDERQRYRPYGRFRVFRSDFCTCTLVSIYRSNAPVA